MHRGNGPATIVTVRQFSFAGSKAPATIRGAQALLFLQGGLLVLAGLFILSISLLFGSGNAIAFAGGMLSGAGAVTLGAFYGALGAAAVYIGIGLGRASAWSRTASIGLEAVLIIVFLARGDGSISSVLDVLLCVAVAALVLTEIFRTDRR